MKLLFVVENYLPHIGGVEVLFKHLCEGLAKKNEVKSKKDFIELAELVDKFRELNYSKKRKRHILTP